MTTPKRPRTDDGHVPDASNEVDDTPITRSDIWFSDGSIVLQAEKTQFKVHRTLLCRHSTIFTDTFSMPQPDNGPKVEGCDLAVIPDSAEDIKHMLLALYDKCYHINGPIPFNAVAAILRMGRKYDIKDLEAEATARLTLEIPSTLDKARSTLTRDHIRREPRLLYKIINLAQKFEITQVLPLAYFMCLVEGIDYLADPQPGPDSEGYLDGNTQRCIARALPGIVHSHWNMFCWIQDLGRYNDESNEDCESESKCEKVKNAFFQEMWRPEPDLDFLLKDWQTVLKDVEDSSDFYMHQEYGIGLTGTEVLPAVCGPCQKTAEQHWKEGRQKFWQGLPSRFSLPEWNVLRKTGNP